MVIIDIQHLRRVYTGEGNPVVALHCLDLTIQRGEFICVAGPSGSGKSTLLNLIGALDTPSSGKIVIDGIEINGLNRTGLAEFRRKKIGFIFQFFNLLPSLTVYENIEYALLLQGIRYRERKNRLMAVLNDVGLFDLRKSFPGKLSGGQQQRVAVARAIVGQPPIILADEPTSSLDSANGLELLNLFTRLNRERKITFIFSSHDPCVIERAARVITLHDGMLSNISQAS